MAEQGAVKDATDAAASAVDAMKNVGEKAADLTTESAADVWRTGVRMLERIGDAVFGKQ